MSLRLEVGQQCPSPYKSPRPASLSASQDLSCRNTRACAPGLVEIFIAALHLKQRWKRLGLGPSKGTAEGRQMPSSRGYHSVAPWGAQHQLLSVLREPAAPSPSSALSGRGVAPARGNWGWGDLISTLGPNFLNEEAVLTMARFAVFCRE